jgi:hypothetical protein
VGTAFALSTKRCPHRWLPQDMSSTMAQGWVPALSPVLCPRLSLEHPPVVEHHGDLNCFRWAVKPHCALSHRTGIAPTRVLLNFLCDATGKAEQE